MKITITIILLIGIYSCGDYKLNNTRFYATPVIMSSSSYITASTYEFAIDTYKIHLQRSFEDTAGVIIEKGTYKSKGKSVTTTLECKLICDATISDPSVQVLCGRFGTYHKDGYFLCSDSISNRQMIDFAFQKRDFLITRNKGKLILTSRKNRYEKLFEM